MKKDGLKERKKVADEGLPRWPGAGGTSLIVACA